MERQTQASAMGRYRHLKYLCLPTVTCFRRGRKAGTRVGHAIPLRVDYKS